MHTDYYSLLGVNPSATVDEIKAAYRRLAQRLHPDISGDPRDEERFKQVARAYQILRDPDARARYEVESMERELDVCERELNSFPPAHEFTAPPPAPATPAPGASWERDFGDREAPQAEQSRGRFKPSPAGRPARDAADGYPVRGEDYEVVAEITLEEAVRGGPVTITFAVPVRGPNGRAREVERSVEIRVPKLAVVGQRLRVKGEGGAGANGGPDGDLHVEIAYKPHPLFRLRDPHEAWFYLPIAPWEAVLGAVIEIPTLNKPFRLHVPKGATSGQVFRLAGRGLPKSDGSRGDLLACLRIVTPEVPNEQERALYLQLARASRFNPRRGFG